MGQYQITDGEMTAFHAYLCREERAKATIEKYMHDLRMFSLWLEGRSVTKELVTAWKESLLTSGYQAVTVNSALAALHSFFRFAEWEKCRVKYLKVQKRMFRDASKDLSKEEYLRLVQTAQKQGKKRLAMLLETICSTGIRVSEVQYITVEAVGKGRVDISLKGKIRTILIPGRLAHKLQKYAKKRKIISGEIFLGASGKGMSRRKIWGEMKGLCTAAHVDARKVFPHNLRHLFARIFYKSCKNIVQLADVLGHSCIETTRIYLLATGTEHQRQLDRLGLVS